MSYEYSENILVQDSASKLLKEKLNWETVFAYDKETFGPNGTLGRQSTREVVLTRYLKQALFSLNDWLDDDTYKQAETVILEASVSKSVIQINEEKYKLFKEGVPVKRRNNSGVLVDEKVRVFNFKEPLNNHFLAVGEMKIHGEIYRRRTDIVGFVNGIPLLFVELKRQDKDAKAAYTDNYRDYLDTIPQLFYHNALIMFSTGLVAKVGTLGSKFEFFNEWKRLKEEDKGRVDLETMLLGMCRKENLIDIFENFILYDRSFGKTVKILARNHQYLGVNEAVKSYEERKLRDGKLGVFWHTQGSGKSYSMVFFAQKVRRKFEGSPTFIILTDREELDKQIGDTFEACGCLTASTLKKSRPRSGEHLLDMLKDNNSFIFTLIQKFNKTAPTPCMPEHDVIVVSDEAHRSQYGTFAENLRELLPTASYIGFTGTPLFSNDNITRRWFGEDVSIYDFQRAVEDNATVPLYYENRGDNLGIINPEINEQMMQVIEESDLDGDQRARLERDLGREYHVITSDERLDRIARDYVEHYTDIWTTGKSMFICIDKITTVRMYDLVQKYWQEKLKQLEKELTKIMDQQASQDATRKIEWMKSTEMCVVISPEQNEVDNFRKWGIDIKPHREKIVKRELDKEFKDDSSGLRVVFVCAMWLTGFDVKSLATLYIDKPLKAHTLMQTIARANRVYEGKANGLIVDYIGVLKHLRKALATYATGGKDDEGNGNEGRDVAKEKEELLKRIEELVFEIHVYFDEQEYSLKKLFTVEGFDKLNLLRDAANIVCQNDETRKRFEIMARELFKMTKGVSAKELTQNTRKTKDAVDAIYNVIQDNRQKADITDIMIKLHGVVSESIKTNNVETPMGNYLVQSRKFDISKIDFERLKQEFEKNKHKNLIVQELKEALENKLQMLLNRNPARIDFYKRYQKIIDEYNLEQDSTLIEKTFSDLMDFFSNLDEEERRYSREGFNNDEELAIYDLLVKDVLSPQEIKKIKKVSHELLEKLKSMIRELNQWREKEETRSKIQVLIKNCLWEELPEGYAENEILEYTDLIYEHVYRLYPAA